MMIRLTGILTMILCTSCGASGFTDPTRELGDPLPDGELHADVIHTPDARGVWHSPLTDDPTLPEHATCGTCHGPNPKDFGTKLPEQDFHSNIEVSHGALRCNHCHDADRTLLHQADGSTFDFSEVITLCGQCHGPIARDYEHGVHGGANGYWDRRQGPRIRDNCVDCHAPHAPAISQVMPVFHPRDRYMGDHR